jgi:hypothetical protein
VLKDTQTAMMAAIERVILTELAKIQFEIDERQQVIEAAEEATQSHTVELTPLLQDKRGPLDAKQNQLIQKKNKLQNTFDTISGGVKEMAQGIEYRILPIQMSQVGPTELHPELAA